MAEICNLPAQMMRDIGLLVRHGWDVKIKPSAAAPPSFELIADRDDWSITAEYLDGGEFVDGEIFCFRDGNAVLVRPIGRYLLRRFAALTNGGLVVYVPEWTQTESNQT